MESSSIYFRPLKEEDIVLLTEWLNREHLQKWWSAEKVTLKDVQKKYLPRISKDDAARPFIVMLDDRPAGYIQYYFADKGDPGWWPDKPAAGVLGIDQFIADSSDLGQGLGTQIIIQFIQFLKEEIDIKEIRVDPHPDNFRAIRCYEKVGFIRKDIISTPDGLAQMMALDMATFSYKS